MSNPKDQELYGKGGVSINVTSLNKEGEGQPVNEGIDGVESSVMHGSMQFTSGNEQQDKILELDLAEEMGNKNTEKTAQAIVGDDANDVKEKIIKAEERVDMILAKSLESGQIAEENNAVDINNTTDNPDELINEIGVAGKAKKIIDTKKELTENLGNKPQSSKEMELAFKGMSEEQIQNIKSIEGKLKKEKELLADLEKQYQAVEDNIASVLDGGSPTALRGEVEMIKQKVDKLKKELKAEINKAETVVQKKETVEGDTPKDIKVGIRSIGDLTNSVREAVIDLGMNPSDKDFNKKVEIAVGNFIEDLYPEGSGEEELAEYKGIINLLTRGQTMLGIRLGEDGVINLSIEKGNGDMESNQMSMSVPEKLTNATADDYDSMAKVA